MVSDNGTIRGQTWQSIRRSPTERLPPWLDLESCEGCEERYKDFRPFAGARKGGDLFSRIKRDLEPFIAGERPEVGEWYWSRGSILYALRAAKINLWIERHRWCDPSEMESCQMDERTVEQLTSGEERTLRERFSSVTSWLRSPWRGRGCREVRLRDELYIDACPRCNRIGGGIGVCTECALEDLRQAAGAMLEEVLDGELSRLRADAPVSLPDGPPAALLDVMGCPVESRHHATWAEVLETIREWRESGRELEELRTALLMAAV